MRVRTREQRIAWDAGWEYLGERAGQRQASPVAVTDPVKLWAVLARNSQVSLNLEVQGSPHFNADAGSQPLDLTLTAVTMQGDPETCPILCDTNGQSYGGVHWSSNTTTHEVLSHPALYVSGSRMTAEATFQVSGAVSTQLVVRAVGNGYTFQGTTAIAQGATTCSPTVTATTLLPANRVDFLNPLTLEWSYALAGSPQFASAGTSTNQVYVSWHAPATANLFHTVVDVACRNAIGGTTESNIVAGIWSDFDGPIPGVESWNGVKMQYWGPYAQSAASDPEVCGSTGDLVKYSDGKCGAWAELLKDTLGTHGFWIPLSTTITTDSILTNGWFGIGFVVYASLPGQGNSSPPNRFANHGVLRYGGLVYDPSYGVLHTTELGWEDSSLLSLAYELNSITFEVPDTKAVQETSFFP